MKVSVKIDGFDNLAKITRSIYTGLTRKEVNKVLRKNAKPVLLAVKSKTPIADKTVIRRLKNGQVAAIYDPGNLEEAMQIMTGRKGKSREEPTVYIGANVKSNKRYDGYYWYFVVKGTKDIAPNDFIGKAANPMKQSTQNQIVKELVALLNKKIQR